MMARCYLNQCWPSSVAPYGVNVDAVVFLVIGFSVQQDQFSTLDWRHNGRDSVSNHRQPHDCLFNRLFRRRSKKTSNLRVTGLCVGNSPGTGEFPAQMASNAENVSIWWRHHDRVSLKIACRIFLCCHTSNDLDSHVSSTFMEPWLVFVWFIFIYMQTYHICLFGSTPHVD